jgi:ubiquinone/menaquinone biosynthesis C-methylase UbiE
MDQLEYHLSSDKILGKTISIVKKFFDKNSTGNYLDIGSGNGTLVELVKRVSPNLKPFCVDYTDELLRNKEIPLSVVDLNIEKLPYEDSFFDLITCTEVVEHLENYRLIIRESYRVAKPNAKIIFTTPNILNLNSRLRYLQFGFHSLFGPLTVDREEAFSTGGHITPVSYFYLAHSLLEAGYREVKVEFDKKQSSSYFWLALLYPIIATMCFFTTKRESKKKTINPTNDFIVSELNTIDMLLGRTIVVSAVKPS